jgi:gamma-glutamyl phosphate reductase
VQVISSPFGVVKSSRIDGICDSLHALMGLKDPVGSGELFTTPNGLEITCTRVPLGVVAIIY